MCASVFRGQHRPIAIKGQDHDIESMLRAKFGGDGDGFAEIRLQAAQAVHRQFGFGPIRRNEACPRITRIICNRGGIDQERNFTSEASFYKCATQRRRTRALVVVLKANAVDLVDPGVDRFQ